MMKVKNQDTLCNLDVSSCVLIVVIFHLCLKIILYLITCLHQCGKSVSLRHFCSSSFILSDLIYFSVTRFILNPLVFFKCIYTFKLNCYNGLNKIHFHSHVSL